MQSNHRAGSRESTRTGRNEPTGTDTAGEDGDALVELLGDTYTREILTALSEESLSAAALVDRLDMSRATVYRRLDDLRDHGLVATETAVWPDGNHHEVFEAAIRRLTVDLSGGTPTVTVDRRDDRDDRTPPKPPISAD